MTIDRLTVVDTQYRDSIVSAPIKCGMGRSIHMVRTQVRSQFMRYRPVVTNGGEAVTVRPALPDLVCVSGHGQVVTQEGQHKD